MDLNVNRGKSLGTSGSDIYAPCFYGESSPVNVTLPDAPSKSLLYSIPISFGFKTHPDYLKEQARATDFVYNPIIKIENNEPYAYLRTGSGNAVRFHASGLFDQGFFSPVYMPHAEDLEIQRWRDVTEKDNTISYTKPEKEGRLIEGAERLAYFDARDTPLKKFVTPVIAYEGPNNLFGKYLSMNENRRQDIRNILFDNTHRAKYDADTADFANFLSKKYDTMPRTIVGIGTEKMDAVARLYSGNNHSFLTGSTDFYEKAKAMAKAYGLHGRDEIEFVKRAVIYHELVHNFQPRMSEREAEIDVGETLYEYFTKKAKNLEGTKEGRIYKVLATAEEAYAKHWRKKGGKLRKSKNLESKINEVGVEARSLEETIEGNEESDLEYGPNREYKGMSNKDSNGDENKESDGNMKEEVADSSTNNAD